jgi:calcyclin binding protein
MADITADIEELNQLIPTVNSPRIKAVLQKHLAGLEADASKAETAEAAPPPAAPASPTKVKTEPALSDKPPVVDDRLEYISIQNFGWDQGEYNSDKVSVYLTSGLDGVGAIKDNVSCEFGKDSFDLKVRGLNGKNYRLVVDNLDNDIVPDKSKVLVKANKITLKLKKVKGEYSFEHWNDLRSKKNKDEKKKLKSDPSAGIMDMMKVRRSEMDIAR